MFEYLLHLHVLFDSWTVVVCYPGYFYIFEYFPSFAALVCRIQVFLWMFPLVNPTEIVIWQSTGISFFGGPWPNPHVCCNIYWIEQCSKPQLADDYREFRFTIHKYYHQPFWDFLLANQYNGTTTGFEHCPIGRIPTFLHFPFLLVAIAIFDAVLVWLMYGFYHPWWVISNAFCFEP